MELIVVAVVVSCIIIIVIIKKRIKKVKCTCQNCTIYDVIKKRIWMRCNRSFNNNIADCMSEVCALCTKIKNQILENFSKEEVLSLFTIVISNQLKCLKFSKV